MKYSADFKNEQGNEFNISSMEDYIDTPQDIEDFAKVLSDDPVRKYITDDAMTRWNHPTVESLTKDILTHSTLRWEEDAERRFLLRDSKGRAVGMIGVTLDTTDKEKGELWYYKTSAAPSCMYEALVLALQYIKSEGIKELFADFELSNTRSIQILQKLGFKDSKPGRMTIVFE